MLLYSLDGYTREGLYNTSKLELVEDLHYLKVQLDDSLSGGCLQAKMAC